MASGSDNVQTASPGPTRIADERDVLELLREMQGWTTGLLAVHRRKVASNKLLPRATQEQRELMLRIRTDRELLDAVRGASAGTVKRYATRAASTLQEAQALGISIWSLVESRSANVDSWYTFKAGVQRFLEDELVRAKRSLDKWQRDRKARGRSSESDAAGAQLIESLVLLGKSLHGTPTAPPQALKGDRKSKRYAKQSKSFSIRGVPEDWRERTAQTMQGSARLLFLIQCVTGCRPQELANGVQVRLLRNGTLVTRVRGAKTDDVAGQPTRGMRLATTSGVAKELAALLNVGVTVQSRDHIGEVNTYGTTVSRACARAYPDRRGRMRLSAYSVRHQFKADLAAAGWTKPEIAMAMGHSTTRSGTAYGRGGRAGSGGVKPLAIKAVRAVKSRSPYPTATTGAKLGAVKVGGAPRKNKRKL